MPKANFPLTGGKFATSILLRELSFCLNEFRWITRRLVHLDPNGPLSRTSTGTVFRQRARPLVAHPNFALSFALLSHCSHHHGQPRNCALRR